jgi:hypothetical protein
MRCHQPAGHFDEMSPLLRSGRFRSIYRLTGEVPAALRWRKDNGNADDCLKIEFFRLSAPIL